MENIRYPIVPLLEGFEWFDEGLQRALAKRGWPVLTRTESIVMIHVLLGVRRPSDIARRLSLTRQAVHVTLGKIVEKGLFVLQEDPADKRMLAVGLTSMGETMHNDANIIVDRLTAVLAKRLGVRRYRALMDALHGDWGEVVDLDLSDVNATTPALHAGDLTGGSV